jgi:quinol monooxygenase YgiN
MVIVLGNVQVVPHRLQQALAISREHVARSRAEPGCVSHAVYEDPDQPNHLVFVEQWASEEALQAHFAVPASVDFVNALAAMAAGRPRIRMYKAAELPFPGKPSA